MMYSVAVGFALMMACAGVLGAFNQDPPKTAEEVFATEANQSGRFTPSPTESVQPAIPEEPCTTVGDTRYTSNGVLATCAGDNEKRQWTTPGPTPSTTTYTPPPPEDPVPDTEYYSSCADARRAGAAPMRRGDPGYRSGLDRDGDGVACDK